MMKLTLMKRFFDSVDEEWQSPIADKIAARWVEGAAVRCIRASANFAFVVEAPGGIPYLRPEIQLLYKGGSSARRPKDTADLRRMLPFLTAAETRWLRESLLRQFPGGHDWLDALDGRLAGPEEGACRPITG